MPLTWRGGDIEIYVSSGKPPKGQVDHCTKHGLPGADMLLISRAHISALTDDVATFSFKVAL